MGQSFRTNSIIIDLDEIPDKRTVKFIAPDHNGMFELQTINDGEVKSRLFDRTEALEYIKFFAKYL